ncbi:hypothetical protein K443DRAFT_110014 [Laccaria amethystina LaAM-08-1]|uniref:Uncharacterized protein n=1 Tax=Laccaria amethystina LaAM-08-1 TaxID=1095629 RepID=A0A0C9WJG9_9AGAR|nr:hypothetical protein K443DRAFT_110014 [Laccaria amethystina LaAM-08-1]
MATPVWWGVALPTPSTADAGWMVAVQDVGWMLAGLLGTSSSAPISPNTSHVHPLSMSISTSALHKHRH